MRWNLRLAAANRGIWKASELQRLLARHGLVISAGKMSGLWSGQPISIKLTDLDTICAALDCGIEELLVREPNKATLAPAEEPRQATAGSSAGVTPRAPRGRSLPPL